MSTTSLTVTLDSDLKERLDRLAALEAQSSEEIARTALEATIADRESMHDLIERARGEIAAGRTIPAEAVDQWMAEWAEGSETPFPTP